jgi:hypothetical protein
MQNGKTSTKKIRAEPRFTTESGENGDVEMMYNDRKPYLDDGSATGFLKYYADGSTPLPP